MCDGALLCWRWLNTCMLMGSTESISCLALPGCMGFAFHIKLFISSHKFSGFYPPDSFSDTSSGRERESGCLGRGCTVIIFSLQHPIHLMSDRKTLNGTWASGKQRALAVIIPSSNKPSTYPEIFLAVVRNCWLVLPAQVAP